MGVQDEDRGCISQARSAATSSSDNSTKRPILLTIAGFDPSSGAGVSADLKVFAAHGIYGMACITALTVQSTLGVRAVEPMQAATVAATLQMLAEDVTFSGIKLGMLGTGQNAQIINIFLGTWPGVPAVLDPVLRSSSGRELLDSGGLGVIREKLLGRVDWITPNLDELSALTGMRVSRAEEVPPAAEELRRLAREIGNDRMNAVVTGGHLDAPDDYLLTAAGDSHWIAGERVDTKSTHGTGCAFSSALLCRLVAGDPPVLAVTRAKKYVTAALRAAYPVGRGKGPLNHLYRLADEGS
jgi:hydroxymethylpyrimidine/phosphomethylpyrimidine kinase